MVGISDMVNCLLECEPQAGLPHFCQLGACPPTRQRQERILAGSDDQMDALRGRRQMVQQKGDGIVDFTALDAMIIVQDKTQEATATAVLGDGPQFVDQ